MSLEFLGLCFGLVPFPSSHLLLTVSSFPVILHKIHVAIPENIKAIAKRI